MSVKMLLDWKFFADQAADLAGVTRKAA
jgi:hypothetical protein